MSTTIEATRRQTNVINGIDTAAVRQLAATVEADPRQGAARFGVTTAWRGGTTNETRVEAWHLGGERIAKDFTLRVDEPLELGGTNTAPNPQEYLLTAINACMLVGYVVGAAMRGVRLDKLEIESHGELDLRGFLGLDPSVAPGYDRGIEYTVRISGDGTPEQFEEIHREVVATSPNRWNAANPIPLTARLEVG